MHLTHQPRRRYQHASNQALKTAYESQYQSEVASAAQTRDDTKAHNAADANERGMLDSGLLANENAKADAQYQQQLANYQSELNSNLASINCQ